MDRTRPKAHVIRLPDKRAVSFCNPRQTTLVVAKLAVHCLLLVACQQVLSDIKLDPGAPPQSHAMASRSLLLQVLEATLVPRLPSALPVMAPARRIVLLHVLQRYPTGIIFISKMPIEARVRPTCIESTLLQPLSLRLLAPPCPCGCGITRPMLIQRRLRPARAAVVPAVLRGTVVGPAIAFVPVLAVRLVRGRSEDSGARGVGCAGGAGLGGDASGSGADAGCEGAVGVEGLGGEGVGGDLAGFLVLGGWGGDLIGVSGAEV